ncbi:MAG: MFS transporter [bacterium]
MIIKKIKNIFFTLHKNKKTPLFILYILGFLFAFTLAMPAYINSSFLKSLTNEKDIGIFYTTGAIFALIFLIFIPKILKRYGNYKVILFLAILYFLNFLGLAFFQNLFLILFCFIISGSMAIAIYFCIDVFIEHNSLNTKTGGIRSIYLTCINLAWLFSPCLAGIIIGESFYKKIYFIVALIMVPVILIILFNLKNFKDPEYKTFNILENIKSINTINKNIKKIIISNFLLQVFFSFMVIYTPIYLNQYLGFSWGTIGIMFSIMLLPFVLIQIPLGYFADKKIGEKEILTLGFIIIGIFTVIIPFISNNFIFWTIILFMTRIGAAMIEVMNDTYFFKNVSDKNLNIINLYRMVIPLSYIITPIIITILMFFIPFNSIFYILGLLMFFGLRYSLGIKDTK